MSSEVEFDEAKELAAARMAVHDLNTIMERLQKHGIAVAILMMPARGDQSCIVQIAMEKLET